MGMDSSRELGSQTKGPYDASDSYRHNGAREGSLSAHGPLRVEDWYPKLQEGKQQVRCGRSLVCLLRSADPAHVHAFGQSNRQLTLHQLLQR